MPAQWRWFVMKKLIVLLVMCIWSVSAFAGKATVGRGVVDQILDVPFEPVYRLSLGYIPSSPVEGFGDVSMTEFDGRWAFAHFWDILFGDIDLGVRLKSTFISNSSIGLDLPGQVAKVALDAGWTGRFGDGVSVQARIYPGIYSDLRDLSSEGLYMPFSVAMIKSFDSKLSGVIGVEIRPDFHQQLMPLLGVAWMINERTRLDARIPESRLVYYLGRGWSTHAGFRWENTSYSVHRNELGANQLTIEDFRFFLGTTFRLSDNLQFGGDVGRVVGRSFEYQNTTAAAKSDFDAEAATFVRFTLGGPF